MDIHFVILVHSSLDLIVPLLGVTYVILLTMTLTCVLVMHTMLNLTLHHIGQYQCCLNLT